MRRFICLLILFSLFYSVCEAAAPGPQDERRIEEQKREDLKSTKAGYQKKKDTSQAEPSHLQPDDIFYIADMSFRKITYGYDLCKTIVILKGVDEQYIDLDSQVAYLKEQHLLPKKLQDSFDPMKPLRRGVTAYALRKALNVNGGIFLNIFRESQRYALKELAYEGIMSSGNINEIMDGDELAAAMTRAVNYMKGQ